MIVPVILSGGSGTRLWPLSRPEQPKQLLAIVDDRTMLRATFDRVEGIPETVDPWVVCNVAHHHLVARELFDAGFKPDNVILEPVGRNTAPAAAAAAIVIAERNPQALMLLLPADHVLQDEPAFHRAVAAAAKPSRQGRLATFGIVPTYPETGYGYIEVGDPVTEDVFQVARFVEKPDLETAEAYVASGNYLWNSGMFLFSVARYLEELERFAPEILTAVRAAVDEAGHHNGVALDTASFQASPSDSIDYAVMERTDSAVVVPLDAGWSDIGSWAALWEITAAEGGNVFVGDVAAVDVTGSYLRSESRLLAAIGVDNLVVVETPDAVMVAPRERSQDVKEMVELLKSLNRKEAQRHGKSAEPWGTAETLTSHGEYTVGRITVEPGVAEPVRLRPSDHDRIWVAAAGSGKVEVAGRTVDITASGAAIPAGRTVAVHVAGPGALHIIEIRRNV